MAQFDWVARLRAGIKDRCGMGWQVVEQSGKCKVTFRPRGQSTRQSTVLSVEWEKNNSREIEDRVAAIKEALDSDPLLDIKSAAAAGAALQGGETGTSAATVDWLALFEGFETYKVKTTEQVKQRTYDREYKPVLEILRTCALSKPYPRNAVKLLESMVEACPSRRAGTASRKSLVSVTCQLLKFSIDKKGLAPNWQPPNDRSDLVGERMTPKKDGRPIDDTDWLRLLDTIEDTHPQWWLALALLGLFGLRPVELLHCRLSDCGAKLNVYYYKRNANTRAENFRAADVPPLPPAARPELEEKVLQALADMPNIQDALPPLGRTNQVGGRVNQFLRNRDVWHHMQAKALDKGEKLTSYGFRHGYAFRAHMVYHLGVRVAARMMRHDTQTHVKHYGKWCDTETIDSAIAHAKSRLANSIAIEQQ